MKQSGRLARLLSSFGAAVFLFGARPAAAQVTSPPADATAGAYTVEQAARGDSVFSQQCVSCHARKDYSNPDFQLKWQGRNAFELFERIRTTMPDTSPGSLSRDVYADLIAYLLKLNGMPTGNAPLLPDSTAMSNIKLVLVPQPNGTSTSSLHFQNTLFRGRQ